MDDITLRKANPSDSQFAYITKRAAFKEYVERVRGWDEIEQLQLHERRFSEQDFRIINMSGLDVGVLALVVGADRIKLNQLFVLPEYQGKGIGTKCMLLVMKEAQQLGLRVCLQVLKVNPRALAFYERLGFMRAGETDTHVLLEKSSTDTLMTRPEE